MSASVFVNMQLFHLHFFEIELERNYWNACSSEMVSFKLTDCLSVGSLTDHDSPTSWGKPEMRNKTIDRVINIYDFVNDGCSHFIFERKVSCNKAIESPATRVNLLDIWRGYQLHRSYSTIDSQFMVCLTSKIRDDQLIACAAND